MNQSFLQAHSEFSLLAGVPSIPQLVSHAKAMGYRAVALTDVNRMSGLLLFYHECLQQNIKPILGVELREEKHPEISVCLLARNNEGYGDLCELTTQRQMQGAKFSLAEAFKKPWPNLFLLSGSPKALRILCDTPNRERLFGALVRHSLEAKLRSREVEALCRREQLFMAASGDSWFLERTDHEVHRILRAIDLNSTLSRLRPGETEPQGAFMPPCEAMWELFNDNTKALHLADYLCEQCVSEPPMGKWIMPQIPVPEGYTADGWLAELAREGLKRNYAGRPDFERAEGIQEMELGVIAKLGYASYFLMVKEVYDYAGQIFSKGYRTPKDCSLLRGSAANSLTFFNLGVGRLDPIQHNLYFQRFLNEDRASPPDADLDFGWDEREQILDYVVNRFGREHVAVTCTFNHFRFRAAFREVAKVFGYAEEQVTEVLDNRHSRANNRADDEVRMLEKWAAKIRGKPHFLGQHPGGLLITNQPIWRHVGCEWSGGGRGDPPDRPYHRLITQVDMHSGIDPLGLIKFDLLGNGSLSVLRDALSQIEEQGLPDPEVWRLERCYDDPATQNLMAEGRTRGIFYLESPAQARLNIKANIRTFDEVTITSSLIRPAGTAYAKTFVERHRKMKRGIVDWDFLHPSLEPILRETHDVCAFQEDVTKICHHVAGLSFKKADAVRKRMNSQHEGDLNSRELAWLEEEFKSGCEIHSGLTPSQAEQLWNRVASFTGFSFCKSHSASYAQLSFQCAYLKAHYPAPFLAAVISNNHGFYRREVYLNEARRWNLKLLPLDINHSRVKYVGKGSFIRPGFLHLRNLSEKTLTRLLSEREENGPYQNLDDFLRRVPAGRKETERLILAGAFDGFGLTQPELLFHLDGVYGATGSGQPSLFGSGDGYRERDLKPGLRDYTLMQRCLNERDLMGYMLSGNPLDILDVHPANRDTVPAAEISRHVGKRIKVFGYYVTERFHRVVKSERLMKFLTLEDRSGSVDVIFWPDVLEKFEDALGEGGPFEVWGKVSEDWDTFSLEAERVRPVAVSPEVVDFELASRRLRAGMEAQPYAALKPAQAA